MSYRGREVREAWPRKVSRRGVPIVVEVFLFVLPSAGMEIEHFREETFTPHLVQQCHKDMADHVRPHKIGDEPVDPPHRLKKRAHRPVGRHGKNHGRAGECHSGHREQAKTVNRSCEWIGNFLIQGTAPMQPGW